MRRSGSLFTFSDISSSVSVGQLVASSSATSVDLVIPYSNRVLNTSSLYSYVQVKPNISHSHMPTWNQVIPSFDPNVLGSWGFGTMPSTNINQFINNGLILSGFHLTVNWSDVSSVSGSYNWTYLRNRIAVFTSASIYFGLEFYVGQNSPNWVLSGSGTFNTTGGSINGPWPVYTSSYYMNHFIGFLQDLTAEFAAYSQSVKDKFLYWQIAEGTTGDEDPYKGTPVISSFTISGSDWEDYRKRSWASASKYLTQATSSLRLMLNIGNDAGDSEHVSGLYPRSFIKQGNLGHDYTFDGQTIYYNRNKKIANTPHYYFRSRAEYGDRDTDISSGYAPNQQSWLIVINAIAGGLGMFNFPQPWATSLGNRAANFFRLYAGPRNTYISNRALLVFRDVIDYADEERFPTASYGVLLAPADVTGYNNMTASVLAGSESIDFKEWTINKRFINGYFNQARVTAIYTYATGSLGANYTSLGNNNLYYNDFGYYVPKNYELNMTQISASFTSLGAYRVGVSSSIYGRYARKFDLVGSGSREMYFRFENPLFISGSNNVSMSIVWCDTGSGAWSFTYSGSSQSFVNSNTGTWVSASINVTNFPWGGIHTSGSDFTLKYVSGSNTIFQMIEFLNTSKQ